MKYSKKQEEKKVALSSTNYFFLPLSLFVLLLIGTTVSIIQLQHNQAANSHASINTPPPSQVLQNCDVSSGNLTIKSQEQSLFDQINSYRQRHGISQLVWSAILKRSSAWLSSDMSAHNSLSHRDSLGRDTLTRLEECGAESTEVGENIDNGTADIPTILATWENAPAQNANLLNPDFTQAALAMETAQGQTYWTFDLTTTSPTPSILLTSTVNPTISQKPVTTSTPIVTQVFPTPTVKLTVIPTIIPHATITPTGSSPLPTFALKPSPTPAPTLSPIPFTQNPNDTQVFISVKLPGIGKDGNTSPKHLSRHVQVNFFDVKNQPIISGTGFLRFDGDIFNGIIHLGKLTDNTYYVKIFGDNTLQALVKPQFQTISNTKLNILPQVILLPGDLNNDNVIDLSDFSLLITCFVDQACPNRNAIDFTDNGTVDIVDYNLFLQNFLHHAGD